MKTQQTMPEPLKYDHCKATKPSDVEEWVDFYIFRRLAAYLVKLVLNTSVTPNQITLSSAIFGFTSGLIYYLGFHPILSALLLFSAVTLDCADGQLARARGGGSPGGRFLDGLSDYIVGTSLFGFTLLKLCQHYSDLYIFSVVLVAGISTLIHCYLFDLIKNKYVKQTEEYFDEGVISFADGKGYLKEALQNKNIIDIFTYSMMLLYLSGTSLLEKYISKPSDVTLPYFSEKHAEAYRMTHRTNIRLWTFLGYSSHITLFIIGFLIAPIVTGSLLYSLWMMIIPLNLFMLGIGLCTLYASKSFQDKIK